MINITCLIKKDILTTFLQKELYKYEHLIN